jgi:hypothetical protein
MKDSKAKCRIIQGQTTDGKVGSLQGIVVNAEQYPTITFDLIPYVLIPGQLKLSAPLRNSSFSFQNGCLSVNINQSPLHLDIFPSKSSNMSEGRSSMENSTHLNHSTEIDLPFPVHANVGELILTDTATNKSTTLKKTNLELLLKVQDVFDVQRKEAIRVSLTIGGIHNDLFEGENFKLSMFVPPDDFYTLKQLKVSLGTATVTAGYSSIDWSSMFSSSNHDDSQRTILKTPYATIEGFSLAICVQGAMLSSNAMIYVSPFIGNDNTSSAVLIGHYSETVCSQFPQFLSNVEFLGSNVAESSLSKMGMGAMAKSGAGVMSGGVGSVLGVASLDGIKGRIAAGKKSRNADANEGYKFGDFTRGSMRGLREASKKGAGMRGDSNGDSYVPGDFTAGAVSGLCEYAGENKKKLSVAGGSGTGAMIGLAVAGPLGFVAGSMLGGKAVNSALGKDDVEGKMQLFFSA